MRMLVSMLPFPCLGVQPTVGDENTGVKLGARMGEEDGGLGKNRRAWESGANSPLTALKGGVLSLSPSVFMAERLG